MSLATKMAPVVLSVLAIGLISCSPEATKQYVKPHLEKTQVVQDPNVQYFDPTVDVLFVVDNSTSMDPHQLNLATNISLFTGEFVKNSVLKFQVGVISTDMGTCWVDNCKSQGRLYGPTVKVVTNSTPNANTVLAANIKMGTGGTSTTGYEMMFDPIVEALSPAVLARENLGFYRPSAHLALVFLTDAEDQSEDHSAQQLYQHLLEMKGKDANKVLAYGAIVPSSVTNCQRDPSNTVGQPAPLPVRLEEFLGLVVNGKRGNNIFSLCDTQFGKKLAGLAEDIVNQVGRIFYLDRMPDVNTIRVTYGTSTLPMDPEKGWMFDPTRNAIILGTKIDWTSQPSGSRVMVDYEEAVTDTAKR